MTSPKERPILFKAEMIRAILDGRKTETRRRIKPQPPPETMGYSWHISTDKKRNETFIPRNSNSQQGDPRRRECGPPVRCPYDVPGDQLWVREAHALVPRTAYVCSTDDGVSQLPHRVSPDGHDWAIYREGWTRCAPRWRPSIHMPRWASRLTLEVLEVRAERLQDITEEGAKAEGVAPWDGSPEQPIPCTDKLGGDAPHLLSFACLWDEINGDRDGANWAASPWVWVVSFEVATP